MSLYFDAVYDMGLGCLPLFVTTNRDCLNGSGHDGVGSERVRLGVWLVQHICRLRHSHSYTTHHEYIIGTCYTAPRRLSRAWTLSGLLHFVRERQRALLCRLCYFANRHVADEIS